MSAHDEALDEAKKIVKRYLKLETCGEEDCRICDVLKQRRRRILRALERAKLQK